MAGALVTTYRTVIGLGGGPLLPAVSFLGRLPTAMCQLGSLLLVARTSGSLATAGLVGGALAAGQTVGGPVVGRLADRLGQRPVVLVAALLNACAVTGLVTGALGHAPTAGLAALGALVGLSVPQVGPLSRSRMVALARHAGADERTVSGVLSLEGTLDETSFVLGPALVGVAATVAHPAVALGLAAALLAVCGVAFALHPTARAVAPAGGGRAGAPPRGGGLRDPRPEGSALTGAEVGRGRQRRRGTVHALPSSAALQGAMFGACQAGITALTEDLGAPGQSGLVYAAMGVMSAVVGLAMASVPPAVTLTVRWRAATCAALVLALPLLVVHSLGWLYVVVVILGSAYAPHLITLFSLTERVVPASRMGESMAFMTSGVIGGQALALMAAGPVAEGYGPGAAFGIAVGTAAAACALAWAARPERARERHGGALAPASSAG
ncbi:MFS transporter [Streptomyces tubbatahanensis]|uniref:MFS transporter n=1 Tax=Streptomyces tubbatahanensis TaxID=2923272 RepID=A0ABY3XYT5_9ACTN|nr:MFS transporter [Streptomyces tubbatahanensis]UNS99565.1 MFS transporter [Streptomyces tubbatahanensis]